MDNLTINQLLVLMKEVRNRLNDLRNLRTQVAVKTTSFYGDRETKEIEPQYDVKILDKKITKLETWLFKADAAIKQANAITKVEVEVNVDELLSPIE